MTEPGEDFFVDFTGHFKECSSKKSKPKQRLGPAAVVTGQHPDTYKKESKGVARKPEVDKRKSNSAQLDDVHTKKTTKRKAQGEVADSGAPKKRIGKEDWPFTVDYNDHFETPLRAVQDIQPVLNLLSQKLKKPPSKLVVFDPFYCQGGIRRHYEHLGFDNFIHRNRDFYQDVELGQVPTYDILVTNPPYSADHKERILEFCLRSGKPWALLLPNYVATKAYFGELLDATATPGTQRPFFLTPHVRYNYEHPEGTGHAESPFFSIWYIGLGLQTESIHGACKSRLEAEAGNGPAKQQSKSGGGGGGGAPWSVSIARTVQELRQEGKVPTARRLNPKQRARLKQQRLEGKQS